MSHPSHPCGAAQVCASSFGDVNPSSLCQGYWFSKDLGKEVGLGARRKCQCKWQEVQGVGGRPCQEAKKTLQASTILDCAGLEQLTGLHQIQGSIGEAGTFH